MLENTLQGRPTKPAGIDDIGGAVVALSVDLDDTLWPVWPTIMRAEQALREWLVAEAPATAAAFDTAALRRLRDQVASDRPELRHDVGALRLAVLRSAVQAAGDDAAIADAAFDVFLTARQQVDLYEDALPALQRLAQRFSLLALTNGNADLTRIGIAHHFAGSVSAATVGAGKPDARMFHTACHTLRCAPGSVLHVGDDLTTDVRGALAAGLRAAWVRRSVHDIAPADQRMLDAAGAAGRLIVVPDLTELADRLGC